MISGAMELPVAGEHLLCDGGAALASGLALQELLKTMGQSGTDFRIADKAHFARGKLSIQRNCMVRGAMIPSNLARSQWTRVGHPLLPGES